MDPMDELLDPRAEAILGFWFDGVGPEGPSEEALARWWKQDPEVDAAIEARFAEDVERALEGGYDGWTDTPRGALALVVLLDQLTRNMGRGTPAMYRGDAKALAVCEAALRRELDRGLAPHERQFLYLPLMHAEDLERQQRCCDRYTALAAETGVDVTGFATRHRDIVARFGRFPHRNEVLGRASTPEERAFLEEPGSSF